MNQQITKNGLQNASLKLNDEQLALIEEMAGVCFTPEEISIAIESDWDIIKIEFRNKNSVFYKTYKKGALLHMLNVRKAIYDLAKGGSSASQAEFLRLRRDSDNYIKKYIS